MKSDCCGADIVRRYYNGEYPHARCAKCDKKLTYSNDPAEPREPERRPYRCRDCGKDMPFEEECRFNRDGTVTCYSCWGKEDHIPDATKKVEEHPGRWVVDGVWDRCIDGENYFEVTGSSLAVVRDCILQLEAHYYPEATKKDHPGRWPVKEAEYYRTRPLNDCTVMGQDCVDTADYILQLEARIQELEGELQKINERGRYGE